MEEDHIQNQTKGSTCPFCEGKLISNACPVCNIFIDDIDNSNPEIKKENKKDEEEEDYNWREKYR